MIASGNGTFCTAHFSAVFIEIAWKIKRLSVYKNENLSGSLPLLGLYGVLAILFNMQMVNKLNRSKDLNVCFSLYKSSLEE